MGFFGFIGSYSIPGRHIYPLFVVGRFFHFACILFMAWKFVLVFIGSVVRKFQARVLVLKETYHVTNCAVPPQQPAETPIFPDDRGGGGRRRYEDPLASPCGTPLSCVVRRERGMYLQCFEAARLVSVFPRRGFICSPLNSVSIGGQTVQR